MKYLDSCIMIDAVMVDAPRADRVRTLIDQAFSESELVISPLVDLECMVRPLRTGDKMFAEQVKSGLARFRHVTISDRAYELAAHIRAVHGLKSVDALHCSIASITGCEAIWTFDNEILRAVPGFAVNPL